jgi:hypothetical protein
MASVKTTLTEVGKLLTILAVQIESATVENMPALIDEASDAARTILKCCLASDPSGHLPPEEMEMLRAELVKLGNALEAQIAGVFDIRWVQLASGTVSATRH